MNFKVFLFSVVLTVHAEAGESGICENVPTVLNFDKQKVNKLEKFHQIYCVFKFIQFSGRWYSVLESSDPKLPCLHYDITVNSQNDLRCKFLPYGLISTAIPRNEADETQGFNLQMDFPTLNGSNWNIFSTDYSETFFFEEPVLELSFTQITLVFSVFKLMFYAYQQDLTLDFSLVKNPTLFISIQSLFGHEALKRNSPKKRLQT